jgi:antitoxin MazE
MYMEAAVAQVSKWGNSLAVRIPSKIVKALDLKEGDELNVGVNEAGREFVFKKELAEEEKRALILGLRKYRGQFPDDFKFDRDEANGMDRFDKWGSDRLKQDR